MRRLLLILGVWFSGLSIVEAEIPNNLLPEVQAGNPTVLQVQYFVDTTDQLSVMQLTNRSIHWQSAADLLLILGFTIHPVWCRFTVQQATAAPHSYALELTNFYVDSLTLYQPDVRTGWRIQHTGDLIPFALRTPKTRYPSLYVSVTGITPQPFYARIVSSQHHSYQWQVWDKTAFDTIRLPDIDRYVAFTIVIMMALFLVALLLFMHRFVVLRAYALWGLAVCLSSLFASGFSNILFPQSPYWAHTTNFVTVGLLLPALSYYVVQACHLPRLLPRLVWLYIGFGAVGILYMGLSFFYRHAYITWVLVGVLAVTMGMTLALLIALFLSGNRPAIWNVLALLLLLPIYTYFYGRNAGFFTGSIKEESLRFLMLLSTAAEPFFIVVMLWQATQERIRTAEILTNEKAQRAYVQNVNQLKTDFFTNVSHELRTPVTLLLGPLQSLRSQFPDNELYALMHRNASRLQTLINQLLDLAKLDAQQMKDTPAVGKLTDDIHAWVTQFSSLAKSRSVSLTLQQSQANWFGLYDADKIEKILVNLLSNTLKYTPAGGSVAVDVFYKKTLVTVEVRDSGVGISPEVLTHLFDRFYQGEARIRQEVGTGVGLALTYELVHLLNGTITVSSQLGQGSVFSVSLPLQKQTSFQTTDTISPEQLAGSPPVDAYNADHIVNQVSGNPIVQEADEHPHKPLLLLVEDNEDLRTYIRTILSSHYHLIDAVDGQQGLEVAFDTLPDLIVTDLMMPRLDGFDLCRALRADPRTDHIPLVMLTAKATVEDRLTGLGTGADDYLTKPFLPVELTVRLQNLLRRQASLREHLHRTLIQSVDQETIPVQESLKKTEQLTVESSLFLERLYLVLENDLDHPDFDVEQLADTLAFSSRTLNRKLKIILGLNTRETIRSYRLRRGNDMLELGMQPTQVAYAVGFGSLSSFGRAYKEQYGFSPSTQRVKSH